MEFGDDDLRPMTGASRPQTAIREDNHADEAGNGGAGARPLTAMSTTERQFVDAVGPTSSVGGRPQTGVRPPSGFTVSGMEETADQGSRPKTSRSRVGTAMGRPDQVILAWTRERLHFFKSLLRR